MRDTLNILLSQCVFVWHKWHRQILPKYFAQEVYILFWWKHYRSDSTERKLLKMISDALAFRERDGELSASFADWANQ